jgi:hypothetical protein
LLSNLRTLANTAASNPEIEFNGTRLFLMDLAFDSREKVPRRLEHHLDVLGASSPAPRAKWRNRIAERLRGGFAIDCMRLDEAGRLVHGNPSNLRNYTSYDADVVAVGDGTVVETLNTLDDQKPLPDPKTITLANVDGNHIVLDLGNGVFAFYAHLQKNSITVARGLCVKRGAGTRPFN